MKKEQKTNTKSLCSKCGALCCTYVSLQIDKPTTPGDFEDIRWYICHHDVWVFVDEGDWYVCVERKCRYLTKGNRCGIYEDRPRICRRHRTVNCEYNGQEEDAYELRFDRPEEIQDYAREYFRKKRAKTRAKTRRLRRR